MTELEEQYLEALKKAEEIGAQLVTHGHTSSREVSLSYTKVQEGVMWFEKSNTEKDLRQKQREQFALEHAEL